MGVQSFKFPIDFLNNLEKPIIYIANKHKEILNSVSVYDNLSLTCNLNAFQTASFKIYRDIDGKKQDYFKLFEEEMLIMIPGVSWYEIHVETNIEQTGISKSITANSLEVKLCDKRLVDFQVNSDDFEDDDYVITKFYNPTEPRKSLLNRVLNVSPVWTVGHVDQSLWDIQRTFDESDTDVYSFLTGTVSEAFNCLFTFDTFNQTVNAYDLDNYGSNTNIFVSMDNLAQNMTETIDENSIFTCYRITGGDDIQIAEVNPNGTNKIYNFEYYLPMMPTDLQAKVKQYNAKYQELKPKYEDIVKRLGDQIAVIQELNTRYPDSLASKDWTQYGLSGLETYKKSFETQNQLFCAQGMNKPDSINYNLYQQNLADLNAVTAEYNKRISEINDAVDVYQSIVAEMKALQSELDMNVWFTEDEWKILDSYVIEQTYSNDNFGAVDNTTEAELFAMEKELYDKAWEDLSKKCRPQYQYSSTLANILTIPEFKEFVPYFELGNFIHMETDYDTVIRLRIISFTVDYSNTQTVSVTFSDAIRVKDVYEDASSIQAQANSAAMSFQFNKDQYDKTVKQGNFVAEMRKYGLDVATVAIHNASNQNQTWDDTGFTFRKWNDESQKYDPEQIKIINNLIAISDDGFDKSTVTAIGKIPIDNKGTFVWGVNAQALVSRLVMSENLWIENDSGNYKFDDSGFSATSGVNTVKIQPNNSGELFSIYKGSNKQVYINSDGDVEFSGNLKSATGTFSGLISGGSINLGNGVFTVDKDGNMYASNCTVSGDIYSTNGKIGGWNIGTNSLYSDSISTSIGIFNAELKPAQLSFRSSSLDMIMNPMNIGWSYTDGKICSLIKPESIMSPEYKGNQITLIGASQLTINATSGDGGLKIKGKTTFEDPINPPSRNGSLSGTTDKIVYKTTSGGYKDIPSVGWVTGYVSANTPNTSNFATKNHNHDGRYLQDVYVSNNGNSAASEGRYTSWLYLAVSSSGYYSSFNGYHILASDRRMKEKITDAPDITDAYMLLKPTHFKFKDDAKGVDNHWHYGFIAQDVKKAFEDANIDTFNEALVGYDKNQDMWILDKNEMHAMHVQMIQKHEREIDGLKQEIMKLKEIIKK